MPSFHTIHRCLGSCLLLILMLGVPSASQAQSSQAASWQWVQPLQQPELGGTLTATAVARDRAGDLYLTGQFSGNVRLGGLWLRSVGEWTAFVARLAPDGHCHWASALPLPADQCSTGESIAVDGTGHVWLSGICFYSQSAGPRLPNEDQPAHFVARLDSTGRWQWQQPFRLLAGQESRVGADAQGHGYVNGGPVGAGPVLPAPPLAARLDADGTWGWAVAAGPGQPLGSPALAVGAGGELYLAGQVARPAAARPGGSTKKPAPMVSPFQGVVLALHPDGRPNWQVRVPEASSLLTLGVGPAGELVAAGNREQPTTTRFYSTRRVLSTQLASRELVIAGLSAGGQRRWLSRVASDGTYFAGPGLYAESTLRTQQLSVGPDGDVWLSCALLGSVTFPTTPPVAQSGSGGGGRRRPTMMLAHLTSQGRWQGVSSRSDHGNGAVVAGAGVTYMVQGENDYLFRHSSQPLEDMTLVELAANQPGQRWHPVLDIQCGQGESALQGLAPLPAHGGWAVAGKFTRRLHIGGSTLETNGGGDLLTGHIADDGTWRGLRAGGLAIEDLGSVRSAIATDSSGRLVMTGCGRNPANGAGQDHTLNALLGSEPQPAQSVMQGFIGQADRAGQWRWAHYLMGCDKYEEPALAVAPGGNSWVAYCRPVPDTSEWHQYLGRELVLQQRDADGRLTAEQVLGRGRLVGLQLAPGPDQGWYLAGQVSDSLVLTTSQGPARFRPLAPLGSHQEPSHEQVLLRITARGLVQWAHSLGPSLHVKALVPAPGGGLWLAADLLADSVAVPPQSRTYFPSSVGRWGEVHSSYILGRLDSMGTWRWARPVLGYTPVIAADVGDRLLVAGILAPKYEAVSDTTRPVGPARLYFSQFSAQGQVLATWSAAQALPAQRVETLRVAPTGDLLLVGTFTGGSNSMGGNSAVGYAARLHPTSLSLPVVRRLTPGRAVRGAPITISGTGLDQVRQVLLNNVAADFETVSAELLRVRVPPRLPAGPVRVVVQTGTASVVAPGQLRLR